MMASNGRRAVRPMAVVVSMESNIVAVRRDWCHTRQECEANPTVLVHMNVAGDKEELEQEADDSEPRDTAPRSRRCGG